MLLTIGVDEVGRGPLAGPLVVSAFLIKKKLPTGFTTGLRDSKKLTPKKREEWFSKINKLYERNVIEYSISSVSPKAIDKSGMSWALKNSVEKSLNRLNLSPSKCIILLDGRLQAPKKYLNQKSIIKGDEKEVSIAMASIVAKVYRDNLMTKQAKKFSGYGFEKHKGYGTKAHFASIKSLGLCPIHRRSFLRGFV